jgi:hypothetical protein
MLPISNPFYSICVFYVGRLCCLWFDVGRELGSELELILYKNRFTLRTCLFYIQNNTLLYSNIGSHLVDIWLTFGSHSIHIQLTLRTILCLLSFYIDIRPLRNHIAEMSSYCEPIFFRGRVCRDRSQRVFS